MESIAYLRFMCIFKRINSCFLKSLNINCKNYHLAFIYTYNSKDIEKIKTGLVITLKLCSLLNHLLTLMVNMSHPEIFKKQKKLVKIVITLLDKICLGGHH